MFLCIEQNAHQFPRLSRLLQIIEVISSSVHVGTGNDKELVSIGPLLHSCYLFELFEVDDRAIHELVKDFVHAMVEASVFGSEDEEADGLT